ncbi:MAG: TRAP transporter small permease subunit [Xanthomonadales bacterium]|nr:TRAP transporter small permease subunit [Xanthomonadales bacterium]
MPGTERGWLGRLAAAHDALEEGLGTLLAWLAVALAALVFAVALLRYGFGLGWVALQELAQHLHAALFLLGASLALRRDRHVRVDVLAARLPARARLALEAFGMLLVVLPFALFSLAVSLDYVAASYAIGEGSREPGGLPALWAVKALIPAFALLLALRALALGLAAAHRLARPPG